VVIDVFRQRVCLRQALQNPAKRIEVPDIGTVRAGGLNEKLGQAKAGNEGNEQ